MRAAPSSPWRVLAAVTTAQAVAASGQLGLPAIAAHLRTEFALTGSQLAVVLAAGPIGLAGSVYCWGLLADRHGERGALRAGFAVATLGLALAVAADGFGSLVAALTLAAVGGASAHAAGARAITRAFPPRQHGLALGIRHTAIPVGGAIGAAVLPLLAEGGGAGAAFAALATTAAAVCLFVPFALARRSGRRHASAAHTPAASHAAPHRTPALWLLAAGGAALVVVQLGLVSYLPLYLHDERGWSVHAAAATLSAALVVGATARIALGALSDRLHSRSRLLAIVAACTALALALAAVAPGLAPVGLAAAVALASSWNGVLYAVTASRSSAESSGAAFGMQTTILATSGALAPLLFAAVLHATSWHGAFASLTVMAIVAALTWRRVVAPPGARTA